MTQSPLLESRVIKTPVGVYLPDVNFTGLKAIAVEIEQTPTDACASPEVASLSFRELAKRYDLRQLSEKKFQANVKAACRG